MAMAGIVDDIVKGIKKFGDDVIEGAKNGPGKAARIKQNVHFVGANGNKTGSLADHINNNARAIKKIVSQGRKDFDSLSDKNKEVFKTFEKYADSSGEVKNYADLIASEMDRVRKMSDDDIVKSGINDIKRFAGLDLDPGKNVVGNEKIAKAVRNDITKFIDPATNTPGRVVGDFTGGGLYGSYSAYQNMAAGKKSIMGALKEGHSVVNDAGEKVISGKKVAGTATTVAAAGALGNRVFRDEYGELDVPVVPFI